MDNQRFQTFKEWAEYQGIDPTLLPIVDHLPAKYQVAPVAVHKLHVIADGINKQNNDWKAIYGENPNRKWEVWYDVIEDKSKPSGFGLSYGDYDLRNSFTRVGSRLSFGSSSDAEFFAKTFLEDIEKLIMS